MKLARSTTFSPEKMLSLAIRISLNQCELRGDRWSVAAIQASRCSRRRCCGCRRGDGDLSCASPALELRRPLVEESGGAFLLVFGASAQAKERRFERQSPILAGFHTLVHGLERKADGDGGVGQNALKDGLGARDQLG